MSVWESDDQMKENVCEVPGRCFHKNDDGDEMPKRIKLAFVAGCERGILTTRCFF